MRGKPEWYKKIATWYIGAATALVLCCAALSFAQAPPTTNAPKLPAGLTETETQLIRKETNKAHVEAVLRVADGRLLQALKQSQTNDADMALKELELYGELLRYADDYTRGLTLAVKDRNKILKVLEQAIFKQQRNLEGARQQLPFDYREKTEPLAAAIKRIRLRALDDGLGNGSIIK